MKSESSSLGPSVAILMCTYNGEQYLSRQLDSIFAQTHKNLQIWVSDDNSIDGTLGLLKHYQKKYPDIKFNILKGPCVSSVRNFMSLINNKEIEADYYAFSDQDDIWKEDKIERGVNRLEKENEKIAIYCTPTTLVNAKEEVIGYSPIFKKKPSFKNALVQSIAGGNTMIFNHETIKLLREAGDLENISHDWWTYMIVSGAGGKIFYDAEYTSLLYRQHGNNVVGCDQSFTAMLTRLKQMVVDNDFKNKLDVNTKSLLLVEKLLSNINRNTLLQFCTARKRGILDRAVGIYKSGIYTQTFCGKLRIVIGVLFNKI